MYIEEVGGLPYDRLLLNYLGRKGGKEGKEGGRDGKEGGGKEGDKERQQMFCSQLIAGISIF